MSDTYTEGKTFERTDQFTNALPKGEYENCSFINCTFTNADLSHIQFSDCTFKGCDLSMATLTKTAFREVIFTDCKMLGLHFQNCNDFLFSVAFTNCTLNLSSFFRLKLKKMKFKNCSLQEVDFTETDLSGSILENCDLAGAIFDNTMLEKANLRTAYNYSIDPATNRIKKAKFSLAGIPGLLYTFDIEIEE